MLKHTEYATFDFIITQTIIAINKIINTILEILRKYLYSFSVSGFSGVSSGQKTNTEVADNAVSIKTKTCILFVSHNLTQNKQRNIDVVVATAHFNSLEACIPPAYLLIN